MSHNFSRVSLGNAFRHLSLSSNRVQLRNLLSQNVKVMSFKRLSRRLFHSQRVQHFLRRRNFRQDLFVGHVRKLRRFRILQTGKFVRRSFFFFVVPIGSANRKGNAFRLLGLSSKRSRGAQSRGLFCDDTISEGEEGISLTKFAKEERVPERDPNTDKTPSSSIAGL